MTIKSEISKYKTEITITKINNLNGDNNNKTQFKCNNISQFNSTYCTLVSIITKN